MPPHRTPLEKGQQIYDVRGATLWPIGHKPTGQPLPGSIAIVLHVSTPSPADR